MKKIYKNGLWMVMIAIIVGNAFIFLSGLTLADETRKFEKDIVKLRLENTDLEKKVYQSQSFTYAASMAAALNFTKKIEPVYIDNLLYAKN